MNRFLGFSLIAIFAAFVGSQITEGLLLVPYWKTLPPAEFHTYYARFGPGIGRFYTVFTVVAAIIPLSLSVYCWVKKTPALKWMLGSTLLTVAFVAFFYIYFKGTNQQFMDGVFPAEQLEAELVTWETWHWARVGLELLALGLLVLGVNRFVESR